MTSLRPSSQSTRPGRGSLTGLVDLPLRRPRAVLLVAAVLAIGLGVLGSRVQDDLHKSNPTVPGSLSDREAAAARAHFGDSSSVVVLLRGSRTALDRAGRRTAAALGRVPGVQVQSPWTTRGGRALLRPGGRAILLCRISRDFDTTSSEVVPKLRRALQRTAGPSLSYHMTGYADVASGIERSSLDALKRAELIAAPLLLLVMLLVFRSAVAAALPLLLGTVTIVAARGLLTLVNDHVTPIDVIALDLSAMFGLALGVDYSLLVVSRFREELASGREVQAAARTAQRRAGRTVLFAAAALGASMVAAYLVAPGRVLASGSIGGLSSVLVSAVAAASVLPAILTLLGHRVNRFGLGTSAGPGRIARLAIAAQRRPLLGAVASLAILGVLALPATRLAMRPPDVGTLPASSVERHDAEAIRDQLGSGWSSPYEILAVARGPQGVATPAAQREFGRWQRALAGGPNVAEVYGPSISRDGDAARWMVIDRTAPSSTHDPLRDRLEADGSRLAAATGSRVLVGGPAAGLQDFTETSLARLPLLLLVLSIVTYLMLVMLLRSLILPAVAVALNVLTVAAALGVLVLGFQGSAPLGGQGQVDAIIAPGVIAVVFGLAIDYEVFLLSRMREAWLDGHDVDEAIRHGLRRTAGIITGAAFVMAGVFVAFAQSDIINLRQYGVALLVAVVLDATVVRLFMLPALMRLLGPWAWWMPGSGSRSIAVVADPKLS